MTPHIVSINAGLPQDIVYKGRSIRTSIFKEPVLQRLEVRKLNLDGDRQADLSVHGGEEKAVYAYPIEHYEFWKQELPETEFAHGMFGENFTVSGLLENAIFLGDRFQVGSAEIMVTQPRMPCYKLAARFGRDDMVKRFLASRRTGFYFSVNREGEVGAGDEMLRTFRDPNSITIAQLVEIYLHPENDLSLVQRAIEVTSLPENWRAHLIRAL
jgi:MOSC domain-containing protein YiiM